MHRTLIASALLTFALAGTANAGFQPSVMLADGFSAEDLDRIAIVAVECDADFDCEELVRRAGAKLAELKLPFSVLNEWSVKQYLFKQGEESYRPELRQSMADELGLSAILEIKVPHAERAEGSGAGLGWSAWGSQVNSVRVDLKLLSPEGGFLLRASGTSKSANRLATPESTAANAVQEIFRRAFK